MAGCLATRGTARRQSPGYLGYVPSISATSTAAQSPPIVDLPRDAPSDRTNSGKCREGTDTTLGIFAWRAGAFVDRRSRPGADPVGDHREKARSKPALLGGTGTPARGPIHARSSDPCRDGTRRRPVSFRRVGTLTFSGGRFGNRARTARLARVLERRPRPRRSDRSSVSGNRSQRCRGNRLKAAAVRSW
jgi:hypothetical protein